MINSALKWGGKIAVCIASGPSLCAEDIALVRRAHSEGRCKVLVVNREFESAPWADAMYAADLAFWQSYWNEIRSAFPGERWTVDVRAARQFGLQLLRRARGEGFSVEPGTINTGGNSGFQALHIAAQWGAARIVLLGYDMQRTQGKEHHFGRHKNRLPNGAGFKDWIPRFRPLIRDLEARGVRVVNATRETALPAEWCPRSALEAAL